MLEVGFLSFVVGSVAGALVMRRYLTGRFWGAAPAVKPPEKPPSGASPK